MTHASIGGVAENTPVTSSPFRGSDSSHHPPGTLNFINKLEWAFLWFAKDTTTGAKCKVNWESVCCLKKLGGLGVVNMDKFAMSLRLPWP